MLHASDFAASDCDLSHHPQSNSTFEEACACGPSGAKLAKLLKARPLCTLLGSTGVSSQGELLLITLVRGDGAYVSTHIVYGCSI